MFFINFGVFRLLFLWLFFPDSFFFWDIHCAYVSMFDVVSLKNCSFYFNIFSLCFSDWIISIDLSSSSLNFSIILNLLLRPSSGGWKQLQARRPQSSNILIQSFSNSSWISTSQFIVWFRVLKGLFLTTLSFYNYFFVRKIC